MVKAKNDGDKIVPILEADESKEMTLKKPAMQWFDLDKDFED